MVDRVFKSKIGWWYHLTVWVMAACTVLTFVKSNNIIGMIFLLIGFLIKDDLIERVRLTASVLLAHLALLFVPAGVGIVRHWDRISSEWLAIAAILVVGTAITMVVTALVIQWSAKLLGVDDDD